ncbi:BadF/BadG/BcrA/BcrD ATPase family protein [Roseateles violae]|uniref:BadF/BadG/BcrA/BcrD ATPase family protein n=1 Tax=Roseateles violae TaxID=3058042 RepID=A0ABT8DTS6_9BURK|nr:BadF/BadG/BcrA/BcrD ATPase family protein [Pelomonas sp. PFR6]MDN3919724.1 BadF/BadG/BcrA/BcrD ATPase family protein [Pelomonas sp. PFR6]
MSTALLCPTGPEAAQTLADLRFLVGVDGGGTGTRLRLADREGRLLGQGEAGPSALGQGSEQAWRHIAQALAGAAAQAGIDELNLAQCAIGLGMSGASVVAQAEAFLQRQPGFALLALDGDGWTTVLGAHGGRPGAVIAAGTGTIGEALRADGSRACVSGWGWITGDEGSGAWLGLRAVRHLQEVLDGRAAGGPLAEALRARCGAERASLLAWNASAGQAGFASLAPLVFEHAERDPFAATLIEQAVIELEKLALALDPAQALPMALCGSIAQRLAPRFSPALRARCVAAQGDSAAGGLHLVRGELQKLGF